MKRRDTSDDFRITLLDAATLLYHIHTGSTHFREHVGYEDCERTLKQLTAVLAPKRVVVPKDALESALWSCNLMDEIGEWWAPDGSSFDGFMNRLLRYARPDERIEYDRMYSFIRQSRADALDPSHDEPQSEK